MASITMASWNSILLGQRDVTVTTDGYNYLAEV